MWGEEKALKPCRQSLVDGQELVSFHAQAIAWTPETVRQPNPENFER